MHTSITRSRSATTGGIAIMALVALGVVALVAAVVLASLAQSGRPGQVGVAREVLQIANGAGANEFVQRPNILIAWRNSEKILELETRVRNPEPREVPAGITMEILDASGK